MWFIFVNADCLYTLHMHINLSKLFAWRLCVNVEGLQAKRLHTVKKLKLG